MLIPEETEPLLMAQWHLEKNLSVLLRLFTPTSGWIWYVISMNPMITDQLYGVVVPGFGTGPQYATFKLSELQAWSNARTGEHIERDVHFKNRRVEELFPFLPGS